MDGDDCFVAERNTSLVSLCAGTGERRWSVRIKNPYGWLAFNLQTVFYLNQHALLIAVDRRTGELRWSRELFGINGWLHASEERVVVGGWRGYSDIVALDTNDGHTCWSRSARRAELHSTRVHAESQSLVIVESQKSRIAFLRLTDGNEIAEYPVGDWDDKFIEHPTGTTRPSDAAIVQRNQNELLVIAGTDPSIRVVTISMTIWSKNLTCSGSVVPFVTPTHELSAFHLNDNRVLSLGPIRHNRRDILPFCELSTESFLVGTSFGELRHLSRSGQKIASQRVGKRIATNIALAGKVAVCGTDSGEVVGVDVTMDG